MQTNIVKKIPYILIGIFVIAGFWFRFQGIEKGLSFWNDEDHTALMSRGILTYGHPQTEIGTNNGIYQIAYYYLTATSFKLLGVNEFAGRLPSVIAGTLLIFFIFLITKKILNVRAAIIASFLTAFSQMQLAWSTQLRPYIWLELFTLGMFYFSYQSLKEKTIINKELIIALLFAVFAFLFHGSGLLALPIIAFVIFYKSFIQKKYFYILLLLPLGLILYLVIKFSFPSLLTTLFNFNLDFLHYRIFLTHNYHWLILGSIIGGFSLYKKNRELLILLIFSIFSIFFLAITKLNTQYVRYSLPAFPMMYILFAAGLVYLGDLISKKLLSFRGGTTRNLKGIPKQVRDDNSTFSYLVIGIMFVIFLAYPIYKGKILLQPKYYYSINNDVRENPIVDYKYAFQRINKLTNDLKNNKLIVMDAWNDRVPYYMPGQKFILLHKSPPNYIDPTYGEKLVGTRMLFEKEKQIYQSGIVIVENWESLTPPELQDHIRKTLKHEFDVNNLPYNEDDKWSISIYSWGIK